MRCNSCNCQRYLSKENVWICPNMMCEAKQKTEIKITEFNKNMSEDERNYYGEEYDENR